MTRIVRIVPLASATGQYGGPFDTSLRQVLIAEKCGFQATLVAGTTRGDEPHVSDETTNLIKLFHVRNWLPQIGFAALYSASAFRTLLQQIREADIVHVSAARELIPLTSMLIAISLGKPFIAQPHGMLTSRSSRLHALLDKVVRPLISKADAIVALTEVEAEALRVWLRGRQTTIFVLGNPVPAGVDSGVRKRPRRLEALFVARLHPRKRVGVFLSAAQRASNQAWAELYVVVGPDGGDLALVEAASHADNVAYEGAISADEVTHRVQQTGVFVLPSLNEPWGNVLALAISAGIPVVVPESAALAAKISEYGAGVVVPDGDGDAIAEAVHLLLTDAAYAKSSAGAVALARAELDADYQAKALTQIYLSSVV
jgi:glycosyltransferase involved in cell wall biosynthesis